MDMKSGRSSTRQSKPRQPVRLISPKSRSPAKREYARSTRRVFLSGLRVVGLGGILVFSGLYIENASIWLLVIVGAVTVMLLMAPHLFGERDVVDDLFHLFH